MPPLLQLQKLQGKGDGGWEKCLCVIFWLTRSSRVHGKKCVLGHPTARAASYCLLPDTFWLWASKMYLKLSWQGKIHKFTITAFHCEESKKQPRDLSDARQKSGELTTPPELPNMLMVLNNFYSVLARYTGILAVPAFVSLPDRGSVSSCFCRSPRQAKVKTDHRSGT